jgi:hypothetical protein
MGMVNIQMDVSFFRVDSGWVTVAEKNLEGQETGDATE